MMTVFLVLGLVGLVLLVLGLVFGDLLGNFDLHLLDTDVFSTAALAAFVGAFGFVGAGVQQIAGITAVSVISGIIGGFLFAWLALWMSRFLRGGERSESWTAASIVGSEATVITDIPTDGFGEIKLNVHGHVTKLNARSAVPVGAGTRVWISGVVSATAVEVNVD